LEYNFTKGFLLSIFSYSFYKKYKNDNLEFNLLNRNSSKSISYVESLLYRYSKKIFEKLIFREDYVKIFNVIFNTHKKEICFVSD